MEELLRASFTYLVCIFVLAGHLYRSFDTIIPYLSVYFKQQFCRLHVTTLVTIFPFFHLDINIYIFFFPKVLGGLFFCICMLFPYQSQYKGKHDINNSCCWMQQFGQVPKTIA